MHNGHTTGHEVSTKADSLSSFTFYVNFYFFLAFIDAMNVKIASIDKC